MGDGSTDLATVAKDVKKLIAKPEVGPLLASRFVTNRHLANFRGRTVEAASIKRTRGKEADVSFQGRAGPIGT